MGRATMSDSEGFMRPYLFIVCKPPDKSGAQSDRKFVKIIKSQSTSSIYRAGLHACGDITHSTKPSPRLFQPEQSPVPLGSSIRTTAPSAVASSQITPFKPPVCPAIPKGAHRPTSSTHSASPVPSVLNSAQPQTRVARAVPGDDLWYPTMRNPAQPLRRSERNKSRPSQNPPQGRPTRRY